MPSLFPTRHPEEARIAQSVAMVKQVRSNSFFLVAMMLLALVVQVAQGFGWVEFAWQLAMGLLAWGAFGSWTRLHGKPAPSAVSARHIRDVIVSHVLCGCFWGLGLIAWTSPAQPQLTLAAVAVSMTLTLHSVAAGFVLPWAVIGFCTPVIAGAALAIAGFETPVVILGLMLIALHAIAAVRQLKINWTRFAEAIEVDVERTRLASMLQEQRALAERAVQQKDRFLASASHDLRQPMHAISLYLDGLSDIELSPHVREVINDARVCTHDMNNMFRSLLDISRMDAQQALPTMSIFGISPILSRVEKEFAPLAASRGIRLKVRPCADHQLYSDAVMVERVVLNFVSNAVRHTRTGGVLLTCRVRGKFLRVGIYDTGSGIPESEHQAIFREFHRLDAAGPRDETGGLGLGLAIVQTLTQALRLKVVLRSRPGHGSLFGVDVPLVYAERKSGAAAEANVGLVGRMVVLVDDEPSILHAAALILEAAGCHVVCARSGAEAQESLAGSARVPDAIVCDYELHDARKGPDVIRALRDEFNWDIPALLITGNTMGGVAEKFAREMAVPLLYKPLEAAAFRNSVEGLLKAKEH